MVTAISRGSRHAVSCTAYALSSHRSCGRIAGPCLALQTKGFQCRRCPHLAPTPFHLLAKPTGAICNLDCKYCFFLSKEMLYPGSRFRMADELLETYIRQLLESQPGPGGHRRLAGRRADVDGPRLLRALDRATCGSISGRRQSVTYTIQTNGTLLDDDWCAFFKKHDVLVGLSVDGPREMHDAYRVDKGGQGTFDDVMRGWECLNRHGVDFNILCTVNAANADHPVEVYRFFRDELQDQLHPVHPDRRTRDAGDAAAGQPRLERARQRSAAAVSARGRPGHRRDRSAPSSGVAS